MKWDRPGGLSYNKDRPGGLSYNKDRPGGLSYNKDRPGGLSYCFSASIAFSIWRSWPARKSAGVLSM